MDLHYCISLIKYRLLRSSSVWAIHLYTEKAVHCTQTLSALVYDDSTRSSEWLHFKSRRGLPPDTRPIFRHLNCLYLP